MIGNLIKKRILITGGAGFIGAHVVDYYLRNTTHDLVLLDRLDTSGNLNRLKELESWDENRVTFVWHDLKAAINDMVAKQIGQIDDVIHLAAASHVDRSIEDPVSFIMDNVVGTTNLLVWAKDGGMRRQIHLDKLVYTGHFINFSTDEVFGPAAPGHNHKEMEQHLPSNPYSASKSGQYAIGYAFWVTYGLPVITTYTMNNYGERQHPEKLIPKAIRSVIEGTEMPIFAEVVNGETKGVGTRFWLHATDTADAIDFVLKNGTPGESYNIVGFVELSNLEVCEEVADAIKSFCDDAEVEHNYKLIPKFVDFHKTRPGHDRRYSLDGHKLKEMGWSPKISFQRGIRQVVEFTIKNDKWR